MDDSSRPRAGKYKDAREGEYAMMCTSSLFWGSKSEYKMRLRSTSRVAARKRVPLP